MMESCLAGWKPVRVGPVEVGDIKRDLLDEFSALPKQAEVQSRSENLQVYLRVRPFTGAESGELQDCVVIEGPHSVAIKAPRSSQSKRQGDKIPPQAAQRFTFTQVFGPDASQRKVFEGSVRGLVQEVLHGENCLLFTYGVTNAGKTFTFLGPEHDSGLLPRCLWVIFNSTEGRLYAGCELKPHRCRDFIRLTPDQQRAESAGKLSLLRSVRENDKNGTSARSTSLEASSLSSDCSVNSISESDSLCLDVPPDVRFSVWVSFCEIYNDNIHDLLEQVPGGHVKRTTLRLSQDVKGNSFIKDLKWVQVNGAEEAFKVMEIGKKNQSLASTRLNQQSSRSHSIFSVRILRVDAVDAVPRFLGVSELVLCDLAGSERCSRTRNTGERLKEAGNINSSLLALGKCINAMRIKQSTKFQQHIPFRESKLTHFLQVFFCSAGKVSMVVNINQNLSCVDETLNVLKFSALAQKVVMLNSRPTSPDDASLRSAMEVSVLINEADQRRNVLARGRKSSMVAWESTLEDVMEDDGEEEDDVDESGMEDETVLKAADENDDEEGEGTIEEEDKLDKEATFRLVAEAQIREEVCAEFMEIFKQMEKDYSERLEKEREILEERAERRLEILKNLLSQTAREKEEGQAAALLEGVLSLVGQDLQKIRVDAQSVQRQLLLANQVDRASARKRRGDDKEEEDDDTEEEGRRRSVLSLTGPRPLPVGGLENLRQDNSPGAGGRLMAKEGESSKCGASLLPAKSPRRQSCRLTQSNNALVDKIFALQTQASSLERNLREEAHRAAVAEDQLAAAEARLRYLEDQRNAKTKAQEVEEGEDPSAFHANMAQLQKECQAAVESSAHKSKVIQEMMQEKMRSDRKCEQLAEELANQKAEYCHQLGELRAELERQGAALRRQTEEDVKRQQDLQRVLREKEKLVEDLEKQADAMRQELERVKAQARRHQEESERIENKENPTMGTLALVEELKEEIQKLHDSRKRRRQEALLQDPLLCTQFCCPLNGAESKDQSAPKKRKSCQVEGLRSSDSKRNKQANIRNVTQEPPSSAVQSSPPLPPSPSVLSGPAESNLGHSVTMATKPKRGRRKLYGKGVAAVLQTSPHPAGAAVADPSEKESDHMIIRRKLRSRTGRK
ncbi:kinesin-like protein KIF20A isoform X2 [Hippocampus comes]|uniref:kinesin-like protein KIF20A isoform X2 n=1 Tax=Hippocampus comes TaxID=109280 RepID=UPI00094E5797|nr:PREDICTED: kinesin-like protein KIF20A isoform X2 [Hippocampus comes]